MARPRSKNPLIFKTVGLTEDQWKWLQLWNSTNPTLALRELLDRAFRFWPSGPFRFR